MPELKVFALKKLDMIVDEFWPEISEAIEKMYVESKQINFFMPFIFIHSIYSLILL